MFGFAGEHQEVLRAGTTNLARSYRQLYFHSIFKLKKLLPVILIDVVLIDA